MRYFAMRRASMVTKGSLPVNFAQQFRRERQRKQRGAGNFEAGRPAAGAVGRFPPELAERRVLAAENVALADAALFHGREVAGGDVVDVDEIEAGVDIAGHPAAGGLHDHAAGGRRLDVARADRRRGVHDHGGKALGAHHGLDHPLRDGLALLVGSYGLLGRGGRGFVDRAAFAVELQGRHRGGVDHARHARARSAAAMMLVTPTCWLRRSRWGRAPTAGSRRRHGRAGPRP